LSVVFVSSYQNKPSGKKKKKKCIAPTHFHMKRFAQGPVLKKRQRQHGYGYYTLTA